jgi:putative acetyltransferase
MHVRQARAAERPALLTLWERSVRATHHFLKEDDIVALRPEVARILAVPAIDWWVLAADDDTAVGFLGFANDAIAALFIDPDHTGAGGGRQLIAQAQSLAGGRSLTVEVNEQQPEAVGFYQAQGFVTFDRTLTDSAGRPFPLLRMRRPAPDHAR